MIIKIQKNKIDSIFSVIPEHIFGDELISDFKNNIEYSFLIPSFTGLMIIKFK